jgi:PKD repeat protein
MNRPEFRWSAAFALSLGLTLFACDRTDQATAPLVRTPRPSFLASSALGSWATLTTMPTARNDLAAGVVNGILYAVGGKTANNCTGLIRVEAYNPVANNWSLKASLPAGRYGLGAAGVGDTLYAFGGDNHCSGALTNEFDAYDPTHDQWAIRTPMQVARYSPASAVVGGVLYVIGGGAGQSIGSVEAYDPGANAWSYKAPMLVALRGFAAVVRDTIYVVGTDETGAIRTEAYDPVNDHWVLKQPMPEVRHAFSGGVANGALYVVGGISDVTHTWVSTVNAYDPASDTWTEVTSAPTARSRAAAGVVDGILYVVGGDLATADDVGVGTNEAFTPGSVAPSCLAPPSGLVSWWKGEGNANDLVGSNSGTLQGAASFSAAEVGQGFTFGSDGDGVTIPNSPSLDVQSPGFTADFWMRGTKNQPENLATVFEKSHGWVDPTGWAFQIGSGVSPNDGVARFYLSDGTFSDIIGSVDVLDGNFHHLAGTWDGSVTRFYVDGVLQGSAFNTTPANNSRGVNIGFTWGGGVPRRFFRGTADELQVYNRALSATEIQAIFAAGSAGVCAPPPIQPPTASAGGPYPGIEGTAVVLDASGSSDPQNLPLTYDWDFGDGSPHGSGVAPTHVYADNGSYTITLSVENASQSTTATTTATIANAPPNVDAGADASALTDQSFALNASFTDLGVGDGPWTTSIDWGNGTPPTQGVVSATGELSGSKVYTLSGTYAVTVVVTDKDGGSGSDLVQVTVAGSNPPVISSVGGPYSGSEGTSIPLSGSASDADGDPLTYSWNFGDGSSPTTPSSSSVATHAYEDNGTYTATLTVNDGRFSSAATAAVTIGNLPPVVDAGPDGSLVIGQPFALTASFSDPGTSDAPWATTIDWGDGSPVALGSTNAQGAITGVHAYLSRGTFTLTVRATDKDGGSGTGTAQVTVINRPPVAAVGGPYGGSEGAAITFNGSGSSDPDADVITYTWDFGDGSAFAAGVTASHTYVDNGTYTVTLTLSDGQLTSSASTMATVLNVPPSALFNHPSTTKEGSRFTISLSNPLDPSPVDQAAGFTYAFDCGGGYGAFSTSISVSCPTVDNGVIPIRAKLRDKDGGVQEYTATQTVTNVAPNVTLNASGSQKIRVGDSFSVTGSFTDVGVQDGPWNVIIDWDNGTTTTTATVQGSPIAQTRVYTVAGTYHVRMKVTDKDGGTGMSSIVTVKVQ